MDQDKNVASESVMSGKESELTLIALTPPSSPEAAPKGTIEICSWSQMEMIFDTCSFVCGQTTKSAGIDLRTTKYNREGHYKSCSLI